MNILADASLPGLELAFPKPFNLTMYQKNDDVQALLSDHQILVCRSTLKINQQLIADNSQIQLIATASSGSDHVDKSFLMTKNIRFFDAKGCNAIAVADYVMACLAYLKKHKALHLQSVGIIGMGHVGTEVARRLSLLDLNLICYDPLRSDLGFQSDSKEQLYDCNCLCIHAALHQDEPYPSASLIDTHFLNQLKSETVIINAARGGIVDEQALLQSSKSIIYCTDVFKNEPQIDTHIVDKATLCTPHIAGHSLEAKFTAVAILSRKIHEYYGLALPQLPAPLQSANPPVDMRLSWEEQVLSCYNPVAETAALKNDVQVFETLRKAHYRHNM